MMDSRTQLVADIKKFFSDSENHPSIEADTDLFKELGLNSIQLVSFIAYLGHLRKEKINPAQIDRDSIRTIDAIIRNYFQQRTE